MERLQHQRDQEYAARENEKANSIGKLFKRKPVSGDGGDLKVTNP